MSGKAQEELEKILSEEKNKGFRILIKGFG